MSLEDVVRCPVCDATTFSEHLECIDHTATKERFHVKHCAQCGLGITSPRPPESSAAAYYQSERYISHSSSSRGLFNSIYLIVRAFTTKWKYALIKPYLKGNGLLDFGCGTGNFLLEVSKHRHLVHGVEPSPIAREKINTSIPSAATLDQLPEKQYDVITLWHVLEHVYPLRETIKKLKGRLVPGGVMFIAVPNHQSPDASHYGSYWAAYDVPRHLWHFTKSSMATFLQQEEFVLVNVIPMKLDAFYVSLLSEGYSRSGSAGFLGAMKALSVALHSNLKADSETNHSSLIFVVRKS